MDKVSLKQTNNNPMFDEVPVIGMMIILCHDSISRHSNQGTPQHTFP